jgi:hypothetical protein
MSFLRKTLKAEPGRRGFDSPLSLLKEKTKVVNKKSKTKQGVEFMEKIAKKSKLSENDAIKIADKIKSAWKP